MAANKVKYNLKNVYYSVISSGPTYATPVAIPGAVSLSLSPETEEYKFYADGIMYYGYNNNNGYSGTLEVALLPESFKKDVLGETLDQDKILVEPSEVQTTYFGLLFEIDGDDHDTKFAFYNGYAQRPDVAAQTTEESIEVQTETLNVTFLPIELDGVNVVKGCTTELTTAGIVSTWFTTFPVPDFTP